MKEARFYEKLEANAVRCHLCPHECKINESKKGICAVRENQNGVLYSLVYGKVVAQAIDPIEKKPLFHFYPGAAAYSIATVGCNFRCRNCQNYDISQMPKDRKRIAGEYKSPEEVVSVAKHYNCRSIAYTYVEPTVFFEFAYDIAKLAHEAGICNVFVSNGYTSEEAIRTLAPVLDGINIDLKGLSEELYHKNCGGHLQPVLDAIKLYKSLGVWVEVTTLVIPTLNDTEADFQGIAEFIKSVGADIPWHISQFYPTYKLDNLPRTPVDTVEMASRIAREMGLRYVYAGNVPGHIEESTRCYSCGEILVHRVGYMIQKNLLQESGNCPFCNAPIAGVWK